MNLHQLVRACKHLIYAMDRSTRDSFALAADKAGRLQKLRHAIEKSMTVVIASVMEDKLPSYKELHEECSQSSTGMYIHPHLLFLTTLHVLELQHRLCYILYLVEDMFLSKITLFPSRQFHATCKRSRKFPQNLQMLYLSSSYTHGCHASLINAACR